MTLSDPKRMTWPDRIRSLRSENELSQSDLAQRLNVRQATVSDWETGKRVPTGAVVRLIEMMENGHALSHPKPENRDE